MMLGNLSFEIDEGDWLQEDEAIKQTSVRGATRCHLKTSKNFAIDAHAKIERSDEEQGRPVGEAKVIFSDADKGEAYRIDFMTGNNLCRVTLSNSIALVTPLRVPLKEEFKIHVVVRNNFLSLQVNGMHLMKDIQIGTTSDGMIGFGTYRAIVSFRKIQIRELIQKKCFVVMPFEERRNFVYEYVIEPALREHPIYDFEITRADKLLTTEKIIQEITDGIEKSDLLIVDISKDNMNVYYELGYGHALKRKAVLLREATPENSGVPFDVRDFRYHPYEFSPSGFGTMKEKLRDIITNVLEDQKNEPNTT